MVARGFELNNPESVDCSISLSYSSSFLGRLLDLSLRVVIEQPTLLNNQIRKCPYPKINIRSRWYRANEKPLESKGSESKTNEPVGEISISDKEKFKDDLI